jgi:hypothetical protein
VTSIEMKNWHPDFDQHDASVHLPPEAGLMWIKLPV